MRATVIIAVLVLAGGLAGYAKYTGAREDLVRQREAIAVAWAQVEAAFQERADLVPDLQSAVEPHVGSRTAVLVELAGARAALLRARTPQRKIDANSRLDQALARLITVVNDDPRLPAGGPVPLLRDELEGAQNRIEVARERYNDAVKRYNTQIKLFPDNLVAFIAGFAPNEVYFKTNVETGPGSRTAPPEKWQPDPAP